jgi:thiol-disulfide isomerase/thioredoxin
MKTLATIKSISLALLVFTAGLTACGSDTAKNPQLSGTVSKHTKTWLFLEQIQGNDIASIDSVQTDEKGNFSFKAQVKVKDFYRLKVSANNTVFLVLDPKESIKYINDGVLLQQEYKLEGSDESKLTLEIKAIRLGINNHRDSLMKAINDAAPAERAQLQISMEKGFNEFVGMQLEKARQIIQNNPDKIATITAAELLDPDQDFASYEKLANSLQKNYPESGFARSFINRVEQMKATAVGALAPEINLPTPDGKNIPLSSLRGKVVLIDFWASWCGPCRAENPNVVKLYQAKKDQGFDIYSVSLDKDKNAWIKAIEKDGLTWPSHVSDLGYWSSSVVKQYGFQGIPFTVLVDREGKIVAKGLRGQQLEEAVTEFLKK